MQKYDLIIIGAGPAGLAAAIYAKRYGLNCLALSSAEQPSQMLYASEIENYPGFEKISGTELLEKMKKQVESIGAVIIEEKVLELKKEKSKKTIITEKNQYEASAIIIATGAKHRKAEIPGEAELLGKGVSYCATCDGPIFKGKTVVVIGGGNTALTSAIYLRQINCKVYLVHRRSEFRGDAVYIEKAKKLGVEFVLERTIKEIYGKKFVEKIILDNNKEIKCDAVFVAIGEVPTVEIIKKIGVKTNKENFIIIDENQATNIEGIFAAGDVCESPLKQIVSAAGSGATAAFSAYKYLQTLQNLKSLKKG